MRSMSYLPDMGLSRHQHEPSGFMTILDHDVPFRLKFIPTKADYRYMARLRKERVRARLTHTPFDYPVRLYTLSLVDYFVRASKPQTYLDGILGDSSLFRRPSYNASPISYSWVMELLALRHLRWPSHHLHIIWALWRSISHMRSMSTRHLSRSET